MVMFLNSCTIEKRHYRSGFYLDFAKSSAIIGEQHRCDSVNKASSVNDPGDSIRTSFRETAENVLFHDTAIAREGTLDDVQTNAITRKEMINRMQYAYLPDEPPPTKDQPNKLIVTLLAVAFFLVACFVFVNIAFLPFWLVVILFISPFVGVLLYALATYYRRKLMQFKAAGATGEKYRVSAHYHRFKIFLLMFFASVLLGLVGFLLVYSTGFGLSGVFGVIGIFMTIAGIGFTELLAIILLVMFLIYWFRWRKDPTGVAKRRNPHPPKGE